MIKNTRRARRKRKGLEKGREIIVLTTNSEYSELMGTELVEKLDKGTEGIDPPKMIFVLAEELSSGSYKDVWKAKSLNGKIETAVQFLKPEHLGEYKTAHSRSDPSKISNAAVRNFMGIETRIAREIRHEHIAQGTGFGVAVVDSPDGENISVPFTTAKLAPKTLGDLLRDKKALKKKDAVWTVDTLLQVGKALEHVRWKGIIEAHGDLQEGNLLFMDDDYNRLVVTDFGVAHDLNTADGKTPLPMRVPPKTKNRTATMHMKGAVISAIHQELQPRTILPTLIHDVYSLGYWGVDLLKRVDGKLAKGGNMGKVSRILQNALMLNFTGDENQFPPRAPGPGTNMLSEFLDQLSEAAGVPYVHHDPRYYMPSIGKLTHTLKVRYDLSKLSDEQRRHFQEHPDELEDKIKQARISFFRRENSGIFGMANAVKSEMAECIKAITERYKDCKEETELVEDRKAEGGFSKETPLQKAGIIIRDSLYELLNRHYAQLSELVESVGESLKEERHNMVGLTDMIHMEEDKYKALRIKIEEESSFAERVRREIYASTLLTDQKSFSINRFHDRYGALLTRLEQQKAYIETFDILHSNVRIERDKVRLSEEAQRNVDEAMAAKAEAEGQAKAYKGQMDTSANAFREQVTKLEEEKATAEQGKTTAENKVKTLERELASKQKRVDEVTGSQRHRQSAFSALKEENTQLKNKSHDLKTKAGIWKKLFGWATGIGATTAVVLGAMWYITNRDLQNSNHLVTELIDEAEELRSGDGNPGPNSHADAGAGDADLGFITREACEQLSVLGYLRRERCEGLPEAGAAEERPETECPAAECPAERPAAKCAPYSTGGDVAIGGCEITRQGDNYYLAHCGTRAVKGRTSVTLGRSVSRLQIKNGRATAAETIYSYVDEHGHSCQSREKVNLRQGDRMFNASYSPDAWYDVARVREKERAASRRRVKRYTDPFD
ncbi:hypothetical protein KY362_07980 [Candidatus Woesearchaeota archaeon]|nr:hypothetical protein [Candidatus Woesearchaeota archaeon]